MTVPVEFTPNVSTVPTTIVTVPGNALRQTPSEKDTGSFDCWSAVPNCVVGIGAGSVTGGAVMLPVPENCVVTVVTAIATPPVGVTVTRNGMTSGVATGHPRGGAMACPDEIACAVIFTAEAPPNGDAFVGLAGMPELHETRSNAMPGSSERAMSRDMGNLRPPESKRPARAPQPAAI